MSVTLALVSSWTLVSGVCISPPLFPREDSNAEVVWFPVRSLSIKRQDGGGRRDVNMSDRMAVMSSLYAECSDVTELIPCAH